MNSPASFPKHLKKMLDPAFYPHEVDNITLSDTHISWIIFTGKFVYKIKKPLDLGFLDFSTLAKRKHYCEEELRLNQRFAPDYYLSVEPILEAGKVIEYAVKMRQFPENQLLSQLAAKGALTVQHIDQIATSIAQIHQSLPQANTSSTYGQASDVFSAAVDNFRVLKQLTSQKDDLTKMEHIENWTTNFMQTQRALFEKRLREGFIRECHGDLHLANITLIDQSPVIFDCIEFNESFRWIDTLSDLAFLIMDLHYYQQPELARRLLNLYLELTGDYAGLKMLRFYLVYRAMVRCKVEAIHHSQSPQQNSAARYQTYLDLALSWLKPQNPKLMITYGFSGSGKSFISQILVENSESIRIRSDVERKRLFGLSVLEQSTPKLKSQMYSSHASQQTYQRLSLLASELIDAGYSTIIDATFLSRQPRQHFQQLAKELRVPFIILHTHAPVSLLRKWIKERALGNKDASEATVEVLEKQILHHDPLDKKELIYTVEFNTENPITPQEILDKIHTINE